ncbi:MAG: glycosyltransferase [Patescibacteria group bacterium]|nr:glycosyltransferase [Patescibacteria group bacterium]
MKVALIHEHLAQDGGAEKVLKVFQEIYPKAPTYTLVYDKKKANKVFRNKDIRTSFIQKFPLGIRKYKWFLMFMPSAVESYDLTEYDLILSSSSAFSKGVITLPKTAHICYCHSPTRYLWSDTHSYVQELSYNRLIKKILPFYLTKLRLWDFSAAQRVDQFIANSKCVEKRINKYYRRSSKIIYPPVETKEFYISDKIGNYYLTGGRLVAYKRFDITVRAFSRLGIPLKVFGVGPEMEKLKEMAKDNVEFLGKVSEEELKKLYSQSIAFIHPQEEDFGITPIESMASGRPVIAYAAGGALETVKAGETGDFFEDQEWEALADKVIRFKPNQFNPQLIKEHALNFDTVRFKENIKNFVKNYYNKYINN